MMEQDAEKQKNLPHGDCHRRWPNHADLRGAKDHRNSNLAKVKPQGSSRVHLPIYMVDLMKAPQSGYSMRQKVPPIECVIEKKDTGYGSGQRGQGKSRQDAPAFGLSQFSQPKRNRCL